MEKRLGRFCQRPAQQQCLPEGQEDDHLHTWDMLGFKGLGV